MTRRKSSQGFALFMVFIAMLVVVPFSLLLVQKIGSMNHLFWRNRITGAARGLSENLAVDYMSQFAKGNAYYEDHFDADALKRTKTFFESGFASVDVAVNAFARTVAVTSKGDYGRNSSAPKSTKSLRALFYFVPLIGQFAIQSRSQSFNMSGATINGPVRSDNDITVTAANVTFNDAVIAKDIIALGSTRFNSQVFYENSFSPGAIYAGGTPIRGVPPGESFTIERDYFRVNSTTQSINVNVAWDFQVGLGGVAQYRSRFDLNNNFVFEGSEPWSPWTNISANGGIFYVQDAKTYLSGIVGARVTIVCSAGPLVTVNRNSMGMIEITGPYFGYPTVVGDPQPLANNNQSLFVIAEYGFVFSLPASSPVGTTLRISGAYCASSYGNMNLGCGSSSNTMIAHNGVPPLSADFYNFVGSRNNMGYCLYFSNASTDNFDPNLQRFPAPGVPSRPVLLDWRRR